MIGRHMNGKIEESENSFIDKSTTAFNRRTDSSQSSPNSVKSTNGEKVAIEYYNEKFKSVSSMDMIYSFEYKLSFYYMI